jgi:hypothetical protein
MKFYFSKKYIHVKYMLYNRLDDQGKSTWFRKHGITSLDTPNINLGERNIKKISPYIYKFYRLRDLNLIKNSINSLPSTIERCKTLESISLTSNKFMSFPSVLFKIKNLKTITIKSNSIEKINKSDTDLLDSNNQLSVLDLGKNNLKKFVISGRRNLSLTRILCEGNPKLRYFEHTSSSNLVYLDIGKGVRELKIDNIKLGQLNSLECISIPIQKTQTNNANIRAARLTISDFVSRNPTLRDDCQVRVYDGDRLVLSLRAREVGNRRANEEAARARNAERRAQEEFRERERRQRDPNRARGQQQTNRAQRQAQENNNAHRRASNQRRQQRNERRRRAEDESASAARREQRRRQAERNRREQQARNTYLLKSGANGTTVWYSYFSPQNGNVNLNNDENVNRNDLFFIDSDVTRNKVIRHLFHKETVNSGLYPTVGGSYEHPLTKVRFSRSDMKMLKNQRYFIDRNIPNNTSNSNNNINRSINNMASNRNINLSRIIVKMSQLNNNNIRLTDVTKKHILTKFYRKMDLLRGETRDTFYKLFKDVVFRHLRLQDKRSAYNYYIKANINSNSSNSNYR